MSINIKATNLELTPDLRKYIEEKVAMLNKYFDGIIEVKVEVELTTHHHQKGDIYRAEFNIAVPGRLLRVEKTTEDIYKAIDKTKDHAAEELKKYKGKMRDRRRRGRE
jgi:putative sigma-54 modulation protein